ncbi:MAG: UDP-N-acetylmuramoyl-tripeptide--D-alanyl-D-alanine ligase [Xanthomonadales bacterium]
MSAGTMRETAGIVGGELAGENRPWAGVSTDTRHIVEGQLFFALSGPNFDGNDYVGAAGERGAAGAVVTRPSAVALPQIRVGDARAALGRLGAEWRNRSSATVIGITGSNGKTTVKELIASCLGRTVLATQGNLNNEIGLPLMLLRLEDEHEYGVFEMGCSRPGDIAWLAGLARPDIGVVTNAGPAHLEGLGSIEGVARTKGEMFQALGPEGTAVINADDPWCGFWETLAGPARVVTFGLRNAADVTATGIRPTSAGSRFLLTAGDDAAEVELPLPGEHNVANACCAAAASLAAGVALEQAAHGLTGARNIGGRMVRRESALGAVVWDDTYNANPTSLAAGASFVASVPGAGWVVAGDMLELGPDAAAIHEAAGADLRAAGIERVYCLGQLCRHLATGFGSGATWYESVDTLVAALQSDLREGVNLLVKGSRGMRMERVVEALTEGRGG